MKATSAPEPAPAARRHDSDRTGAMTGTGSPRHPSAFLTTGGIPLGVFTNIPIGVSDSNWTWVRRRLRQAGVAGFSLWFSQRRPKPGHAECPDG